jgi:5-dehydro-2-deoxygluconokinase
VLLGLEAPEDELIAAFRAAASSPSVKGFAVGRTLFAAAAQDWFAGRIGDEEAVDDMARRFGRLVEAWQSAAHRADEEAGARTPGAGLDVP